MNEKNIGFPLLEYACAAQAPARQPQLVNHLLTIWGYRRGKQSKDRSRHENGKN